MSIPTKQNRTVGLFDSGVGGLFILRELNIKFSNIKLIYFADTLHWPYGNKTKQELMARCISIQDFLHSLSVDAIIIACNTASSLFTHQTLYKNKPLLNIIQLNCKNTIDFVKKTNRKRIGILGTEWTVQSEIYKKILLSQDPTLKIFQQSSPRLTAFVEKEQISSSKCQEIIKEDLKNLMEQKIDVLILGCTHYLFLMDEIKKMIPSSTVIIDSMESLCENLGMHLTINNNLENKENIFLYYNKVDSTFINKSREILNRSKLTPQLVALP